MSNVAVNPQELINALHATYGQTVAALHQKVAELGAANEVLRRERDEYREAAQTPPERIAPKS